MIIAERGGKTPQKWKKKNMGYNLKDYTRDYKRENYSPLNISLRKSDAQKVKDAAKDAGKTVNLFVGELIAAAVPGVEPLRDRRSKKQSDGSK